MCLAQLLAQAARALSLAPAALALVVQLSARVLAVLALAASARAAQALVAQALIELAQVALVALAQVGLAALGFVAVVPKLLPVYGLGPLLALARVRATDLKPLLFRLCWSWPLADWTVQKLFHPRFHTVGVSEVTRWCCCCLLVGLP